MKKMKTFMCIILFLCITFTIHAEGKIFKTIEEAVKVAEKTNQNIIVNFTGSDWCIWCVRLHKEVFKTEEWKKQKKYLMVELDYPKAKKQSAEEKAYNRRIQKEYGVRGYPTIYVLDSKGRPYVQTGYRRGGPKAYLKYLKSFEGRPKYIANLLKKVEQAPAKDKLDTIAQVLSFVKKWNVSFGYDELKKEAIKLDPDNKNKMRARFALELAKKYKADPVKSKEYMEIVKQYSPKEHTNIILERKYDPIIRKNIQEQKWKENLKVFEKIIAEGASGEFLQMVYYSQAGSYYKLNDMVKTLEALRKSVKAAPNSKIASQLKRQLQYLERIINKQ